MCTVAVSLDLVKNSLLLVGWMCNSTSYLCKQHAMPTDKMPNVRPFVGPSTHE
uniref:Uncharacterized protein n=1 Tax=Lepeophtheirus salmonis TaxID=72036 RepID=A0A0K2T0E3_LEPSM